MPDLSDPLILTNTICEYVTFGVILWVSIKFYQKYKERGAQVALLLFKTTLLLSFAPVLQSLDNIFLDDLSQRVFGHITSFGFSSALLCAAVSNYFAYRFLQETFQTNPKRYLPVLVGLVNIILDAVVFILRGVGDTHIFIYLMAGHVLIVFYISGTIFRESFANAHKLNELENVRGYQFIGLMGLFAILTYVFFISAEFVPTQAPTIRYVLVSIAWIMAAIGGICAYVGFCRPAWFARHYAKKESP